MNIVHNYDGMKRFREIEFGDVLEYEGVFYMKVNIPGKTYNAIDLEDGRPVEFDIEKWVRPVEHKLIVQ